jgi:DNA-binding response OmpR family regulator
MQPRKVLLIEDDESARYIFATALTHAGYVVSTGRTGTEGLRRLAEDDPDLVVVDIGLPDVDGFQVIRKIRLSARPNVHVLVATVYIFDSDQEMALAAGCDLFLKKPLYPSTLVREVDRLLGGAGGTAPPAAAA